MAARAVELERQGQRATGHRALGRGQVDDHAAGVDLGLAGGQQRPGRYRCRGCGDSGLAGAAHQQALRRHRPDAQRRRAHQRLGAGGKVVTGEGRGDDVAHDARSDQQHDLGARGLVAFGREQAADHRQVTQSGQAPVAAALFVVDQAGKHLGLAVLEAQRGRRAAGADLVGERALRPGHFAHDVADLERDLDRDLVVQGHARHHVELETDIQIADRGRHADVGGGGGGEHRHLLADMHLCLGAVLDPDARIGEQRGVAVLGAQTQHGSGVGDEGHQAAGVVEVDHAVLQGADVLPVDRAPADLLREFEADLAQLGAAHFQHLDLEHHLRLGDVERGDQALGQAHRLGGVLDDQQVELLVDEHVARLHHLLDQVERLLHVGVGEVEAARHQLLVFALLGRRGRVDQHRVGVEQLAVDLLGGGEQLDDLVDRGVAHEDADQRVVAHVAVEHEVEPGGARQGLEHHAQRRVAELQVHLLRQRPSERGHRRLQQAALVEFAQQAAGARIGGGFGQHRAHQAFGVGAVAARVGGLGLVQALQPAALVDERVQAGARARVGGLDAEHLAVQALGLLELREGARALGLVEPAGGEGIAAGEVAGAQVGIARFGDDGLAELAQFGDRISIDRRRVVRHARERRGAAGEQAGGGKREHDERGTRAQIAGSVLFHLVSPARSRAPAVAASAGR